MYWTQNAVVQVNIAQGKLQNASFRVIFALKMQALALFGLLFCVNSLDFSALNWNYFVQDSCVKCIDQL